MDVRRLRSQEGLVRQALVIFIAVAAVFMILLDSFHVFTAWEGVRGDARQAAAEEALPALLNHNNVVDARQAAASYLRSNGETMSFFSVSGWPGGDPLITVTATRDAKTYLFKYGEHLPWVGKLIKHALHAHATRNSATSTTD
jgi:hypothetical protein